ncbi:hypothetical protein NS2_58570 [Nocardia seriolae NBRC 15557]|nr:hypothetical protein NS2_58570 [Nocardia seriolae NBRC 15557]
MVGGLADLGTAGLGLGLGDLVGHLGEQLVHWPTCSFQQTLWQTQRPQPAHRRKSLRTCSTARLKALSLVLEDEPPQWLE